MQIATRYSQGEEQEFILQACGSKPGRFLDIGAFHPTCFSNTRALYDAGWSGVMIEPSPRPFGNLFNEYGNDERIQLILAAVGYERGLAKIYASEDAISTTQEEHFEKWRGYAKYDGSFWIPKVTIGDILNQFGNFDMLSIDVEGNSAALCLDLANFAMQPRCIVVEHDGRELELLEKWGPRGYRLLMKNGENLVMGL